ncbi:hypothetical protein Purlil1_6222 [Purpureocillium lilacinum]|uniref:Uncharacterized protein n=1 Tax=Purpureocillium lilacinum TaxID=33203 RepID=A0ABR0BYR2_PURLI|nr:hypothetical protein Purlil1_6222 [Purpureocillium lilacinum]
MHLQRRNDEADGDNATTDIAPQGLSMAAAGVLVALFAIGMAPSSYSKIPRSTADLTRAMIIVLVFTVFLIRRRLRTLIKGNVNGRGFGMFNFVHWQRSVGNSADSRSRMWWGGGGSLCSEEGGSMSPRVASFQSEFLDPDGSTIRGERLTRMRRSLLRADHGAWLGRT